MPQLKTTATFTDEQLSDEALTTIVARSVLEAALAEDDGAQLWFDVAREGDEEETRLEVELSQSDLEEILKLSGGDDVALTLDADSFAGLFDDPDVEAHGLRGAIAIAVTSAAILAPAGQAAVTQSLGTAATAQRTAAATGQFSPAATRQVARPAATRQVASVQAKLARSQAAKLHSFKLLRSGLVR